MNARDQELERFNARLAELRNDAEEAPVSTDGVFSVGLLMGAGWPGSAATICVLLEQRYPDRLWPWTGNGR